MLGSFAILFCLGLFVYFSFKNVSMLILAPLLAMLLVIISGDMPFLYALTGPFMKTAAGYVGSFFPVFLTGALFGKIMEETGAAESIAKFISHKLLVGKPILAVVLVTALLTYGGVSLFVVVFAVYPIGISLFRENDIPKRLLPGAIAFGAFTFTLTALPGSPQLLNTMPTNPLGTTIYAAPVLGIIASAIMLVAGILWLNYRSSNLKIAGEGYGNHDDIVKNASSGNLPAYTLALIPILLIFVLNWLAVNVFFKNPEISAIYEKFGGVNGTWGVTISLSISILLLLWLMRKNIKDVNGLLTRGAISSMMPIFNTALVVGFGGVVKATAAFATMKAWLLGIQISGLFKVFISTSLIAGIVGSSSGGTGITLDALTPEFLAMGINPEVIHRVMLVGSGGLDSLPFCGAVITLLGVCGITQKDGYLDIGVLTVLIPVISGVAIILLHLATGLV